MASQDWVEKDFYKILGVAKDVGEAELKKVYRKLAKANHPDLHPGDAKAEARFKDISEAYDVLSDKEQRKEYDAIRAMGGGARRVADQHRLAHRLLQPGVGRREDEGADPLRYCGGRHHSGGRHARSHHHVPAELSRPALSGEGTVP